MSKFKFTKLEKISLGCALLILITLFVSSSMTYQQQKLNSAVINYRFGWIEKIIKDWNIYYAGAWHNQHTDQSLAGFTQFFIRKLAHFVSYFFLGLFSYFGLKRTFIIRWTAPFWVWFATVAMASFDEYHQFLTGDRTPSVHDVMLDASGAVCGIILCLLIMWLVKLIKQRRT